MCYAYLKLILVNVVDRSWSSGGRDRFPIHLPSCFSTNCWKDFSYPHWSAFIANQLTVRVWVSGKPFSQNWISWIDLPSFSLLSFFVLMVYFTWFLQPNLPTFLRILIFGWNIFNWQESFHVLIFAISTPSFLCSSSVRSSLVIVFKFL